MTSALTDLRTTNSLIILHYSKPTQFLCYMLDFPKYVSVFIYFGANASFWGVGGWCHTYMPGHHILEILQ